MIESIPVLILILQHKLRMGIGFAEDGKARIGNHAFRGKGGSFSGFHDILWNKNGTDDIVGISFCPFEDAVLPEKQEYMVFHEMCNIDISIYFDPEVNGFDRSRGGDQSFGYNTMVNTPEFGWVLAVSIERDSDLAKIAPKCNWYGELL